MGDMLEDNVFNEFIKFCRQMLLTQNPFSRSCCLVETCPFETIICGSSRDLSASCQLAAGYSDIDMMVVCHNVVAVPNDVHFVRNECVSVLRILTKDVHDGYARLITEDRRHFRHEQLHALIGPHPEILENVVNITIHGPSMCYTNLFDSPTFFHYTSNILAKINDFIMNLRKCITGVDRVPCIYCPFWPREAAEWVTRSRSHGWPPQSVIDKIVASGCHFVAVSHKLRSNNDTEFRFSFSKAENILIDSWSDTQRYCYGILHTVVKLVNKEKGEENDSANLRTYYFKTLMFWYCEKRSKEFWNKSHLRDSLQKLLRKIIKLTTKKCLNNYFIPANNIMDYISDSVSLQKELTIMSICLENIDLYLNDILTDITTLSFSSSIWFPAFLLQRFQIYSYILYKYNCHDLKSSTLSDIDKALVFEFSDLYRGLDFHLQALEITENNESKQTMFDLARNYLEQAAMIDTRTISSVNFGGNLSLLSFTDMAHAGRCFESSNGSILVDKNCNPSSWRRLATVSQLNSKTLIYCRIQQQTPANLISYFCRQFMCRSPRPLQDAITSWSSGYCGRFLQSLHERTAYNIADWNKFWLDPANETFSDKMLSLLNGVTENTEQAGSIELYEDLFRTFSLFAVKHSPEDGILFGSCFENIMNGFYGDNGPFNMSKLCTNIYLADFYFNLRPDDIVALFLCGEVLKLCDNHRSTFVSMVTFPVLLTTRLIRLFDQEIQLIFGFVTLYRRLARAMMKRSVSDEVVIAFAPALFANYLIERYRVHMWVTPHARRMLREKLSQSWMLGHSLSSITCWPSETLKAHHIRCLIEAVIKAGADDFEVYFFVRALQIRCAEVLPIIDVDIQVVFGFDALCRRSAADWRTASVRNVWTKK